MGYLMKTEEMTGTGGDTDDAPSQVIFTRSANHATIIYEPNLGLEEEGILHKINTYIKCIGNTKLSQNGTDYIIQRLIYGWSSGESKWHSLEVKLFIPKVDTGHTLTIWRQKGVHEPGTVITNYCSTIFIQIRNNIFHTI